MPESPRRRPTARLAGAAAVALLLGTAVLAAPAHAGGKGPNTNRTPDAAFDKPGAYTLDVTGRAAGGATMRVFGAQGANGGGGSPAGKGGGVTVRITLQAGEQLQIRVGGRGQQPSDGQRRVPGGFNGGGDGGIAVGRGNPHDFWQFNGGSGGGASDIRRGGDALANRIVVAAGGGGGGANGMGVEGSGGADGGAPAGGTGGDTGGRGWTMHGGAGGTQTNGGDGGLAVGQDAVAGRGEDGKAGAGGNGGRAQVGMIEENAGGSGGGGGGGYFGGGGGAGGPLRTHPTVVYPGAGGGGGSSFAPPGAEFTSGVEKGDGRVEIFFDASPHLASIDPSKPWSFRTQRVGTVSDPREVKVENKGTEPLVVESVGVRGSAPGDYKLDEHCTGKRIPADDTCTIEVRFAPTSLIPSIAAIVVRVNVPGEPELQSVTGGAGTLAEEPPDNSDRSPGTASET